MLTERGIKKKARKARLIAKRTDWSRLERLVVGPSTGIENAERHHLLPISDHLEEALQYLEEDILSFYLRRTKSRSKYSQP